MYQKIVLFFTMFFFVFCLFLYGQKEINDYIYSIRVTTGNNTQIIQTGFRLSGTRGIITALHGVAGAKEITAVNETGSVYLKLKVIHADINKDAALLYSDKMMQLPLSGLVPIGSSLVSAKENLRVLGHPQGIGLIMKSVTAGSPVIKPLSSLIPPDKSSLFAQRKSPDPSINVIYIEGSLVAGNSGSPVLNSNNNVIGIVNGGILGGAAGISWAIPIAEIKLDNFSNANDLFINLPTSELFNFQYLNPVVSTKTKQYAVDYFEIAAVQNVSRSYRLSDIVATHLIEEKLGAPTEDSIRLLARNVVLSYLTSDAGSRAIRKLMAEYWKSNTYGQILTFQTGTSFDNLRQWTKDDAVEKYSVGLNYDERLCKVQKLDVNRWYSDKSNNWKGNIRAVTLELNFVTAVCSPKKHGLYSEEEMDSLQSNWTKFVVLDMIKN